MKPCSIVGCDGVAKTRGWCQAHYMRWFLTGTTGSATVVRRPKGRTCSVPGCDRKHSGRGYCDAHLQRVQATGDPGPAEIEPRRPGQACKIAGCEKPATGRGWCNAHYLRWRNTGDPLTPLPAHGANWTGDDATYAAVHGRLRAVRGPASAHKCTSCERMAHHWAYDGSEIAPKTGPRGQPYTTDLSKYVPMCGSCHRIMDAPRTKASGCKVVGCTRAHKARGLCDKHYLAARRAERRSASQ